jgi:hypothetical protein
VCLLLSQPPFSGDVRFDIVDDVARERGFYVEQPARSRESFANESSRHGGDVMTVGRGVEVVLLYCSSVVVGNVR